MAINIPETTREEQEAALKIRKQAMLLINAEMLAEFNRSTSFYDNFLILEGKNSSLASELVARKGVKELFDLTPAQLAAFIPRIRLFKQVHRGDPLVTRDVNNLIDVEFQFPEHVYQPGVGVQITPDGEFTGNVGLKSFKYEFKGGDPAQQYFVDCEFTLMFRSFHDLVAEQIDPVSGEKIRFLDLIHVKSATDDKTKEHSEFHTIKAVVGWTNPLRNDTIPQNIKDSIDSMNLIMTLHLIEEQIEEKEAGAFELTCRYTGALEQVYLSQTTNILESPEIARIRNQIRKNEAVIAQKRREIKEHLELSDQIGINLMDPISPEHANKLFQEGLISVDEVASLSKRMTYDDIFFKYAWSEQYSDVLAATIDERLISIGEVKEILDRRWKLNGTRDTYEGQNKALQKDLQVEKSKRYARLLNDIIEKGRAFYIDIPREKLGAYAKIMSAPIVGINVEHKQYFTENDEVQRKLFEEELSNARSLASLSMSDIKIINDEAAFSALNNLTDANTTRLKNEIAELEKQVISVNPEFLIETDAEIKRKLSYLHGGTEGNAAKTAKLKSVLKLREQLRKKKKALERLKVADNFSLAGEAANPDKSIRTEFIYLGDILDAALQVLKMNDSPLMQNSELLLGNLVLFTGEKQISVNLADIPISLELFTNFFVETVVNQGKEVYLFRDFMADIINRLLPEALRLVDRNILGGRLAEVDFTSFSLPGNNRREVFSEFAINGRIQVRPGIFREKISNALINSFKTKDESTFNYLLINGTIPVAIDLHGDEEKDFQSGVYHLYSGNERGLVKRISWKKTSDPNLRAANLQKHENSADLNILRDFYQASVEMIGNSLFYPGQLCFLNPILLGFGDPRDPRSSAYQIGLGGYFKVISVESDLDASGFNTTVNCLHEALAVPDAQMQARIAADAIREFGEAAADAIREFGEAAADAFNLGG